MMRLTKAMIAVNQMDSDQLENIYEALQFMEGGELVQELLDALIADEEDPEVDYNQIQGEILEETINGKPT